MEVTIDKSNIKDYGTKINEQVTKIIWLAGPLVQSVIDCFPNLNYLDCDYNRLTNLDALTNCVNLQILDCGYNQLANLNINSFA